MDDMTSIDAPAVRAMGVAVTGIGDQLMAAAAPIPGWEYAGKGAVEGSIMCDTRLAHAARFWKITVDGLGGWIRDYGGNLRTAAGDFVATDHDAADVIQTVGKPD